MSNYEVKPKILFEETNIKSGYNSLFKNKDHIIMETYPGVRKEEIIRNISSDYPDLIIIDTDDFSNFSKSDFRKFISEDLTEDRIFGYFTRKRYEESFDLDLIKSKAEEIKDNKYIVIGICAYLFKEFLEEALIIYADMPRWEIQLRYRNNEGVYFKGGNEKDKLKNFKRGYFIEWRMADNIKQTIWNKIDIFLDTTKSNDPKWITSSKMKEYLNKTSKRPFRLVPYFDAGVWGGKWMKEKLNLGENEYSKWAWGFDGVPEENSLIFKDKSGELELPAINLVFFESKNLLGYSVWNRFGSEFPIRFDFLDTINGQNLSLQVHPTTEYMKKFFGGHYTQEESYYILDVDESASPACYLGVTNDFNKSEFFKELEKAQESGKIDINKYVNKFPVKKHDHLSHPAGVIHSSASGCMVLEISATPYIFTFKLWDWGRLGLDGMPRPINLSRGKEVLLEEYNTDISKKELFSPMQNLECEKDYLLERTGLHKTQYIETHRHTLKNNIKKVILTHDSVNMLNLVEGDKITVSSPSKSFPPLEINYAETFIIPEHCKEFIIESKTDKKVMLLQAYVRT